VKHSIIHLESIPTHPATPMIHPLKTIRSFHTAGLILATAASALAAPITADTANALIDKHQDAIVEVRLVNSIGVRLIDGPEELADMLAQAPREEQEFNVKGVTIHPSGLVAVPGLPLDPTMILSEMSLATPFGELKLGLESLLSNVRILATDGRELEADVVMRDRDTGLMLIKPRETPGQDQPALVPDPDTTQPPPFSQVLCISRMPAAFADQPTATLSRTTGALETRRGIDALTGVAQSALGAAVFDAGGHFLGIAVIPAGGGGSMPSTRDLGLYLLPAATLHNLAKDHTN